MVSFESMTKVGHYDSNLKVIIIFYYFYSIICINKKKMIMFYKINLMQKLTNGIKTLP